MPSEPIHRILFPTDFSPSANRAQAYAERLAACTDATLLVLHVRQEVLTEDPAPNSDERLKLMFEGIPAYESDLKIEHLVLGGSPGEVICWIAQEKECDQIVMGTHGRTGLFNLLIGSTAEHVVRHARCPVLTVPSRPSTEEPLKEPVFTREMPRVQPL